MNAIPGYKSSIPYSEIVEGASFLDRRLHEEACIKENARHPGKGCLKAIVKDYTIIR